ncbi:hypothetical protein V6N13_057154 [Hibiscus sabdariffa]
MACGIFEGPKTIIAGLNEATLLVFDDYTKERCIAAFLLAKKKAYAGDPATRRLPSLFQDLSPVQDSYRSRNILGANLEGSLLFVGSAVEEEGTFCFAFDPTKTETANKDLDCFERWVGPKQPTFEYQGDFGREVGDGD